MSAGEQAALRGVQMSQGYKILQALWATQGAKIMDSMMKAAGKGQESAWRFYAGQMKGFDLAITQLDRALEQMAKEDINLEEQKTAEQLLAEIRGERQ